MTCVVIVLALNYPPLTIKMTNSQFTAIIFPFHIFQINKAIVAMLLVTTLIHLSEAESKSKIESTSQSIVSRLNPALRKVICIQLTNRVICGSLTDLQPEFILSIDNILH